VEIVSIFGVLRRHRLGMVLGLVLAVAAGAFVGGLLPPGAHHRGQTTYETVSQVMVDTRTPLVATVNPTAGQTVVPRSVFLSAVVDTDATAAKIAAQAGVSRDELSVVGPTLPPVNLFGLLPDGLLPQSALTASLAAANTPYIVELVPNPTVPIIEIGTAAPTVRAAIALAHAAMTALRSATLPPAQAGSPPATPRPSLTVESLGPLAAGGFTGSSVHLLRAVAGAIALFALWCAGLVCASGIARGWRNASRPLPRAIA
jgi:hypothetical protein